MLLSAEPYRAEAVTQEDEQDPAKAEPLEYAIKGRKYIKEHTGL